MNFEDNLLTYNYHWCTEVIIITVVGLGIVAGCLISLFINHGEPLYLNGY